MQIYHITDTLFLCICRINLLRKPEAFSMICREWRKLRSIFAISATNLLWFFLLLSHFFPLDCQFGRFLEKNPFWVANIFMYKNASITMLPHIMWLIPLNLFLALHLKNLGVVRKVKRTAFLWSIKLVGCWRSEYDLNTYGMSQSRSSHKYI